MFLFKKKNMTHHTNTIMHTWNLHKAARLHKNEKKRRYKQGRNRVSRTCRPA